MLFNSFEFLIFFPVVVSIYFLMPTRWRWLHLLIASYVFYMAWEPAYAILIFASVHTALPLLPRVKRLRT